MAAEKSTAANINDVAAYILARGGSMSTYKLQKLAYYSQAWSLVWDDTPLFDDAIQAWANGPVVYSLYSQHRGAFAVDVWPSGDATKLTETQRETVDAVIRDYGKLTGHQLSQLTHAERPWQEARAGLGPTDRSNAVITHESMAEYYGSLAYDPGAPSPQDITWNT